MYHLESAINRLLTIRSTIHYIANDEEILKNVDLPNFFGDLSLDTLYPDVKMDEYFKNDYDNYDVHFFSFPPSLYSYLKCFIQNYADFNSDSEEYYNQSEYWIKLKRLNSWERLKKSAKELMPHFDEYLTTIGISKNE